MSEEQNRELMGYFSFLHLPDNLAQVSSNFHALAQQLDNQLPNCDQKTQALRKLLEAKDCAVRSVL